MECTKEKKVQSPAELEPCNEVCYEYMGLWVCPIHGFIRPIEPGEVK